MNWNLQKAFQYLFLFFQTQQYSRKVLEKYMEVNESDTFQQKCVGMNWDLVEFARGKKVESNGARGAARAPPQWGRAFLFAARCLHTSQPPRGRDSPACVSHALPQRCGAETDGRTDSSRASCSGVWWAGWGDRRGWGTWMLWKEKRGNFHSSSHSSALLSVRVSKAQQHADLSSGRQEPSKCWLYWFWIVKLIVISFFSTILDVEAPSS